MKDDDLGDASYDEHEFGHPWWFSRARDKAHQRAYRNIVDFGAKFLPEKPREIVDYACGPGMLIRELARKFPDTVITGIDESQECLDAAAEVLREAGFDPSDDRFRLLRRRLPNLDVEGPQADAAFFVFPDFRCGKVKKTVDYWARIYPADWQATKKLRKKVAAMFEKGEVEESRDLFYKRMASRHLHRLVEPGGIVVRVDYSECHRDECDEDLNKVLEWEEGCRKPAKGFPKGLRFTEMLDSRFFRSKVMEDVYEQTEDPDDKEGGFMVTAFRAR